MTGFVGGTKVGDILTLENPSAIGPGNGFSVPVATVTSSATENVAVGRRAGGNGQLSDRNVYIGVESGRHNNGTNNVFIGYKAGQNESNSSNKLIIANTAGTPLIEGTFDAGGGSNGMVRVNGTFLLTASGPANSNDPGNYGQLGFDANYFYVCVQGGNPGVWKRVALSSW